MDVEVTARGRLIVERLRAGHARLKRATRFLWEHRTKTLGTAGMGLGYVQTHQDQLHVFLPEGLAKYSLMGVGAAAFAIGLYNTFVVSKPAPPP